MPKPTSKLLTLLAGLLLVALVCWLRWPTFNSLIWNVDEAIHAAVARILLDGGVLYRDAVDQRTPLSYWLVAALFRFTGPNNIVALHVLTAGLVAATAFLVFLLGRRLRGRATGLWSAGLYAVMATGLFFQGDANAFNTEWLVALFTTAAALVFWWRPARLSFRRTVLTGLFCSLAFLSKQPALLSVAVPALVLIWLWGRDRASGGKMCRQLLALGSGFIIPVLLTLAYFWRHHALHDLIFYTWTYNLAYYGPEVATPARLLTAFIPFAKLAAFSPALLVILASTSLGLVWVLVQRQPTPAEARHNPRAVYLLAWALFALAGAVSGGRGYDHYFIQFLPPLCLLIGWGLHILGSWRGRLLLRAAAWLLIAGAVIPAAWHAGKARERTFAQSPSLRAAHFVRQATNRGDKIFVWGYTPEIYLFADRTPASRFVYASFLTGMIPWTNVAPGRDTSYAIVPGAMDELLQDLAKNRPTVIVDCSAGIDRFWDKYPLTKFPRLHAFIQAHYVEVDSSQFVPQGYRLFFIRDDWRRTPMPLAGGGAAMPPVPPEITNPQYVEPKPGLLRANASDPDGRLQRFALLDSALRPIASLSFAPLPAIEAFFPVPFQDYAGTHEFFARSTLADGVDSLSPAATISTDRTLLSPAKLAGFTLTTYLDTPHAVAVDASFGANVMTDSHPKKLFAHAPSKIIFTLPAGAVSVQGACGLLPGAYAADNKTPTDGVAFAVDWVNLSGHRTRLYHRLLQPATVATDRGPQTFSVKLPVGATGTLEFVTGNGPRHDAASDWSYWTDLRVQISP